MDLVVASPDLPMSVFGGVVLGEAAVFRSSMANRSRACRFDVEGCRFPVEQGESKSSMSFRRRRSVRL